MKEIDKNATVIKFKPNELYRIPKVKSDIIYNWKTVMSDEDIANSILTVYKTWKGLDESLNLYATSLGFDSEHNKWKFERHCDKKIVYMDINTANKTIKYGIYIIDSVDEITMLELK